MSRTSSRWFASSAIAATLALVGCVQIKSDAQVAEDGSGTFKESMALDLAVFEQMATMMKKMAEEMAKGMGLPPPMDDGAPAPSMKPDEEQLAKVKKELSEVPGIEVKSATSEVKDGKAIVHVEASFKTLEAYAKASQLEMNAELVKAEDGSWTLTFESENDMLGDMGKSADPKAPLSKEDALMAASMEKLEMARTLTLPGTIVSTNGTKDGSTVSWKMTFADMQKAGKTIKQTVTFKGDDLDLKAFKVSRKADPMGGMGGPK